MKPAPTCFG